MPPNPLILFSISGKIINSIILFTISSPATLKPSQNNGFGVIKGILVSIAITSEDKNFKEICQTCYMYLAAFEKKEVKDKIETRVAQGLPLLEEIGKIKDKDEKFKKLQEYGKNLPKDKPGYSSEDLKDLQVHLAELFGRLVQV